jgi:uncharacterized repeat protein (TIGR02543 family)
MRDIKQLHPVLQQKIAELQELCSKKGLKIGISECLRTVEEQNELYAQGRTKPGNIVTNANGSTYSSMHMWGTACDFYRNDGKGAYYDNDGFFTKVGKLGQSIGLEWGGSWKSIVDKPHFQLPDWGSTPTLLKSTYKMPENFFKTWTYSIEYVLNGGKNSSKNDKTYKYGTKYILKNPTRKGYIFKGWYLEPSFNTKVLYVQDSSVKVYAKWEFTNPVVGEQYTVLKSLYLRSSVKGEKVKYHDLKETIKAKCIHDEMCYALLSKNSTFVLTKKKTIKDTVWGQMKAGYWLPLIKDGEAKIK